MTKKILSLLIACIMIFGVTVFAEGEDGTAASEPVAITLTVGEKSITAGGISVDLDVAPCIVNDRTMLPMRAIFELLGATVEWDGETKTVFGVANEVIVVMQIGQSFMFVNTTRVELDSPAIIINDRTMVPLRAIAEAYGSKVDYDDATKTITITK